MNHYIPLLASAALFTSASTLVTPPSDSPLPHPKPSPQNSKTALGGGSECLAGCNEQDHCITNDRWKSFNPHYECRFSYMPYTCNNVYGDTWCNRIKGPNCQFPTVLLDETTSSQCAEGVPDRQKDPVID